MSHAKVIWMDGELVPWEDATVHVTTHGLNYGAGVFEGIRCYRTSEGPAIFRLDDHLRRLFNSAKLYLVSPQYTRDELRDACYATVVENALEDCYLRPMLFLGESEDPLAAKLRSVIVALPRGPLAGRPHDGVRAKVSSYRRIDANVIPPAAKATGQYLNSFIAKIEALTSGYDEPILLNGSGHVTDGWAHNVFVVQDGVLLTPPTSAGALGGITRNSIMTLAREAGIEVREENLVRTDLYFADECFFTGTAAEIVPIVSVDDRVTGTGERGPLTTQLAERFRDVASGRVADHPEWRQLVFR